MKILKFFLTISLPICICLSLESSPKPKKHVAIQRNKPSIFPALPISPSPSQNIEASSLYKRNEISPEDLMQINEIQRFDIKIYVYENETTRQLLPEEIYLELGDDYFAYDGCRITK